jgi:hypothetical protein
VTPVMKAFVNQGSFITNTVRTPFSHINELVRSLYISIVTASETEEENESLQFQDVGDSTSAKLRDLKRL